MKLYIVGKEKYVKLGNGTGDTVTLEVVRINATWCTLRMTTKETITEKVMVIDKPLYFGSFNCTFKVVMIKATYTGYAVLGITAPPEAEIHKCTQQEKDHANVSTLQEL